MASFASASVKRLSAESYFFASEALDDSAELDSAELDSAELDSAELDSAELDSAELDSAELDSADELDSAELDSAELDAADELSFDELELDPHAARLKAMINAHAPVKILFLICLLSFLFLSLLKNILRCSV